MQTTNFGIQNGEFGFTITGATNIPIVVEASTELLTATWTPLLSCTLTVGSVYFSDSTWSKYRVRFYRIRWP